MSTFYSIFVITSIFAVFTSCSKFVGKSQQDQEEGSNYQYGLMIMEIWVLRKNLH